MILIIRIRDHEIIGCLIIIYWYVTVSCRIRVDEMTVCITILRCLTISMRSRYLTILTLCPLSCSTIFMGQIINIPSDYLMRSKMVLAWLIVWSVPLSLIRTFFSILSFLGSCGGCLEANLGAVSSDRSTDICLRDRKNNGTAWGVSLWCNDAYQNSMSKQESSTCRIDATSTSNCAQK